MCNLWVRVYDCEPVCDSESGCSCSCRVQLTPSGVLFGTARNDLQARGPPKDKKDDDNMGQENFFGTVVSGFGATKDRHIWAPKANAKISRFYGSSSGGKNGDALRLKVTMVQESQFRIVFLMTSTAIPERFRVPVSP